MNGNNPLINRYLHRFRTALDTMALDEEERREILGEIENHIAEAASSGAGLVETLERLGPAEDLAKAYGFELMVYPRGRRRPAIRWLTQAGAMLSGLVLVLVFGGTAMALVTGGALGVIAAIIGPFLPPELIDPTLRAGLPQLVVLLVSLVLLGVGLLSLQLLRLNLRLLVLAIHKALSSRFM